MQQATCFEYITGKNECHEKRLAFVIEWKKKRLTPQQQALNYAYFTEKKITEHD